MDTVSDLERSGRRLQTATIVWNLIEVFITIALGIAAGSLALVAFGLDSLIEVFASLVVLWHMNEARTSDRDRHAQRLVAAAFALLALYLTIAAIRSLLLQAEPDASPLGIGYLAVTAIVMFSLAAAKSRIGKRLDSDPFLAEARMTRLDGWLAIAILTALTLNATVGWWWADPVAALIVGAIAAHEAAELARDPRPSIPPEH
jgi:divalent metal cation (Fe/Co/Zn/Cd) transporter